MYPGIDYGHGQTNIDHATGIRFGVISQHSLMPECLDDFEPDYGPPTCGTCGNDAAEYDDEKHGEYKIERGACSDYACEGCERVFDSSDAFGDEALGHVLDDGEYKATMGNDGDIFVLLSPFFTHAQFCSPCAPGAGHLDNPCEDGPKAYCFGHDWFEGDNAPYPIFSVKSGERVLSENEQQEENEPQEGDYVTEDLIRWYQYGKLVLTTADPNDKFAPADDYAEQLRRHMDANRFWPNAWFISDHGNAHRIDF